MKHRFGLWIAIVLLATAPVWALASGPRKEPMAEVPSHVGEYLWLVELDTVPESPDVFDKRVFKIYYDEVTNRLVILGDDDGTRQIPTLTNDLDRIPQTGSALMLDGNGDIATTPVGATNPGYLNVGFDPAEFTWPQDSETKRQGYVFGLSNASTPPGLGLQRVPFMLVESLAVNLNTTSKQGLFTVPTGRTLQIDYWVVRDASGSVTTAVFSGGFNAAADDVLTGRAYTELTSSAYSSPEYAKRGAILGTAGQTFGLKCSVQQGSALTVTVEIYGHYVG